MQRQEVSPDYGAQCYRQALEHQSKGEFELADECFILAVKHNHPPALFRMGVQLHAFGYLSKAIGWYRKAAELGDANGRYKVWCYERGKLFPPPQAVKDQAEFWFRFGKLYYILPRPDYFAALIAFREAERLGHSGAGEWVEACEKKLAEG